MKKDNLLYIRDISDAIDWILNDYVKDVSFSDFAGNHEKIDAVIRQIAVIGEAMKNLSDEFISLHKDLPSKEAVAMRNILVHDYDDVDVDELWKTITVDLPSLREIVEAILNPN